MVETRGCGRVSPNGGTFDVEPRTLGPTEGDCMTTKPTMNRTRAVRPVLAGALMMAMAACTPAPASPSPASATPTPPPTAEESIPAESPSPPTEDSCPASDESVGVDFIDLELPDPLELQQHTAETPSMLFESFDSSVCQDGSQRAVVTLTPKSGDTSGAVGLWVELADAVQLVTGKTADIRGNQVLNVSLNGVSWDPDNIEIPETPVDEGGAIAEAQWLEGTGGSANLLLGLDEASQFRAFTLTDPYRVVVDVRP